MSYTMFLFSQEMKLDGSASRMHLTLLHRLLSHHQHIQLLQIYMEIQFSLWVSDFIFFLKCHYYHRHGLNLHLCIVSSFVCGRNNSHIVITMIAVIVLIAAIVCFKEIQDKPNEKH